MSSRVRILVAVAVCLACCFCATGQAAGAEPDTTNGRPPFRPADLFQLEYAADPQISPDGSQVAYLRNSLDIMTDQVKSRLWLVSVDGREHQPLTEWQVDASSPRWCGSRQCGPTTAARVVAAALRERRGGKMR